MNTKTKKILAVVCWFAIIIGWNMFAQYNGIELSNWIKVFIDAVFVCAGTLIFTWIFNPGFFKNKKE